MDPEMAARELAVADDRLGRGAELIVPRWLTPVLLVLVVVQTGVSRDVSSPRWRALVLLVVGVALLVCAVLAATRARARALPVRAGWRFGLLAVAVAVLAWAAMTGLGLVLRSLGVPLPFTAGAVVVAAALLPVVPRVRRWEGGYVDRVRRGQW